MTDTPRDDLDYDSVRLYRGYAICSVEDVNEARPHLQALVTYDALDGMARDGVPAGSKILGVRVTEEITADGRVEFRLPLIVIPPKESA